MPRPLDGWPALGGVVHRVLARDAADYIADDTRHAAEVLLRRLRRDVLRALAGATTRTAPGRLGVGRGPLMAARAEGGWLREGGDGVEWSDDERVGPVRNRQPERAL